MEFRTADSPPLAFSLMIGAIDLLFNWDGRTSHRNLPPACGTSTEIRSHRDH
jgi:hypothetical protein